MIKNMLLMLTFCLVLTFFAGCGSESAVVVEEEDDTSLADESLLGEKQEGAADMDSENLDEKDKKKPMVYKRTDNLDEFSNNKPNHDVKLRKALTELNIAIKYKNYSKAYGIYRSARKIETDNESLKKELKQSGKLIQPYVEAFKNVIKIEFRKELERIYLNNTQGYLGSVIEDNKSKKFLVIQDIKTNNFVKIKYVNIAKRENISSAEQKKMMREEFEEIAGDFDNDTPDSIAYLKHAKLAWQYGQKNQAYESLSKALKLGNDLIKQTISLEVDSAYSEFQSALKNENFDKAKNLLTVLMNKYPKAEIFRKAALRINKHFEKDQEMDDQQKKDIADAIVKRNQQDEKEFSDEISNPKKNNSGKPTKTSTKKPNMPVVDPKSDLIKEKLQLPLDELLAEAEKEYNTALNFDRKSRPGAPEAAKNLDLAIYHYQIAKKLFDAARDKGAEIGNKLVLINKALFWCRKRHKI